MRHTPNSECEQPVHVIGFMVVRRPILTLCGITLFIKDKYMTTCQGVSLKKTPRAHMFKLDQADIVEVNLHMSNFAKIKQSINHNGNFAD